LIGDDTSNLLTGAGGDDVALGKGADDMITTGAGDDFIDAGLGADTVIAGAGNDTVYGGDGADTIFGNAGKDMIDAGNGDDNVFGGADNDTFVARANDGSDGYHGDAGVDTLDMSAVMANITANLGTGLSGSVTVGSVTDQLYGIENIVTGGGNDTITASGEHNVIDTGAHSGTGHDTVIFRSASDANGDTILNFEAGDKIDVSGFMGGAVTLVNGTTASAGQIAYSFENIAGENFTVLHGHDAQDNEFQVNIKGHHNLTGTDFAA
jgi:Ca2+-binding RTX toxin-like protein